jgi:AraC-like DNA-binding protein
MYSEIASNKHFHIIPKPVFEHLCSLDITRAQQNVFMFIYGEARIQNSSFAEIPTKTIAQKLSLSVSTVKRAFSALKEVGLIERHDQGRCRFNPMRSAVTKTEILLPESLKEKLQNSPDRKDAAQKAPQSALRAKNETKQTRAAVSIKKPKYEALHDENETHEGNTPPATDTASSISIVNDALGLTRKISRHYAFKLMDMLKGLVESRKVGAICNQILWSLEQGSLAPYPLTKGRNIALKLVRQNRWTPPKDMPEHWSWSPV